MKIDRRRMYLPEVLRSTGLGRSSIYRMIQERKFPEQIKETSRVSFWLRFEVESWIKRGQKKSERMKLQVKYTADQQRIANYIADISSIGGGDDPVGFLIASHQAIGLQRNQWRDKAEAGAVMLIKMRALLVEALDQLPARGNLRRRIRQTIGE